MKASIFQKHVLAWYNKHGRKDLPWQQNINPYRVWVSEIMLQQTQVSTVINYFERFISRFPNVQSLADAKQDEVLHYWTGLGYYARGRNLHACAKIIVKEYDGVFPQTLEALEKLPGIGKSTANAIISIAYNKKAAILDGNVKRVLIRYFAIKEWYGNTETLKKLWLLAESLAPSKHARNYTQAMMDIGAMICTRGHPTCDICPLNCDCIAYKKGLASDLPVKKSKRHMPIKEVNMIIMRNSRHEILLEKRAFDRIWNNLYSFPEQQPDDSSTVAEFCLEKYGYSINSTEVLDSFRHTFSHFHLDITPIVVDIAENVLSLSEPNPLITWYKPNDDKQTIGLSAPVKRLLLQLSEEVNT